MPVTPAVAGIIRELEYVFGDPERLDIYTLISLDIEGFPITVGNNFPYIVSVQLACLANPTQATAPVSLLHWIHSQHPDDSEMTRFYHQGKMGYALLLKSSADICNTLLALFSAMLYNKLTLTGFNLAFDLGCITNTFPHTTDAVFKLYKANLAVCVALREVILSIAYDRYRFDPRFRRKDPFYTLDMLCQHYLERSASDSKDKNKDKSIMLPEPKNGSWRLAYCHLSDVPFKYWPEDSKRYARNDAIDTILVFCCQTAEPRKDSIDSGPIFYSNVVVDSYRQSRKAFALSQICAAGMFRNKNRSVNFIIDSARGFSQVKDFGKLLGFIRGVHTVDADALRQFLIEHMEVEITPALNYALSEFSRVAPGIRALQRKIKDFFNRRAEGKRCNEILQFLVREACVRYGTEPLLTDGGERRYGTVPPPAHAVPLEFISCKEDALKKSGCPILTLYGEHMSAIKLFTSFAPILLRGPSSTVICSGNKPCLITGRSSMFDPNPTQLPREGMYRECWEAPPVFTAYTLPDGKVQVISTEDLCVNSTDYHLNEMVALAEVTTGMGFDSIMAKDLNAGIDPHCSLGADIEGIEYGLFMEWYKGLRGPDYRKKAKNARQYAKIGNFGGMGGMWADSFVEYAYGYGIVVSVARAEQILKLFRARFTEMDQYFSFMKQVTGKRGSRELAAHLSGRIRAGLTFTKACNYTFQALAADGGGCAMFEMVYRTKIFHADTPDVLGVIVNNWIHDESLSAGPRYHDEWVYQLADIQVACMQVWTRHVTTRAEGCKSLVFSKSAELVLDDKGMIIPWDPKDDKGTIMTRVSISIEGDAWER